MDLLAQYGDDDDDDECGNETKRVGQGSASATFRSTGVVAAPEVSNPPPPPPLFLHIHTTRFTVLHSFSFFISSSSSNFLYQIDTAGLALTENKVVRVGESLRFQDPSRRVVYENLKYDELYAPLAGPSRAHESSNYYSNASGSSSGQKNHPLGYVQATHVSRFNFDKQFQDFHSSGRAEDPGGGKRNVAFVGANDRKRPKKITKTLEEKEVPAGEEEEEADPFEWRGSKTPWKERTWEAAEYTEEQKKLIEEEKEKKKEEVAVPVEKREDKSFFHGKAERDYAGRSWVEPPKHLKKENDHCYVPKRCIHTWSGHSKGVNAIRFFPESGHLLLSAGLDSKVKIWDVSNTGRCMRTYLGHEKGVRDICFTNDGRKFVSTGYDRNIKLWDTETGQVIRTLSSGKMLGYCVKFHPDEDKQNLVLCGCSDKKIYQFDTETGDIVQEYNEHLGAVNSITFVDENRRFVSSSDDKSLRVWDFGIPVQIKYIADPSMHSMPSVAAHPDGSYIVGQSLDNTIVIYSTKEKFKMNRKRTFRGHNNAGYACQVNFSPDGRFVISGDGEGRCFFWDWKTSRVFRKMKCHTGVCMGAEWHPLETSKVATCGWDGLIKYWD